MRLRAWGLVPALGLVSANALAEGPVPSLDLRDFHPPTDPSGWLYVEPATTPGPGNWNFGAFASYALSPVVLDDANGNVLARVVHHQLSLDYFGNVGIGKRFAVGAMVPTVLYQSGDNPGVALPGSAELPHVAFGDATVDVKANVLAPSDLGGLGVAAIGRLYVPVGASRSYVSDGSVRGEARLLGELDLLAIAVRATAGVRLRAEQETFLRDGTDDYRFGNDLPWGVGITLRPQIFGVDPGGHVRVTAEARGSLALNPHFGAGPESPALYSLSARYTVKEVSGLLGVELPADKAVGVPAVRPVIGFGWAPRFEDEDGDGIPDDEDQCPELAEDKDGFEDQDGCPDFDNDDDGVPDDSDKCPAQKEDADDFQDDDGCPDPDNDGDGVLDAQDACPNVKGPATGPKPGCPDPDPDHDGILGDQDKCPDQPEDRDGFQDADGCPDPDNDGDGVLDGVDACPEEKGEPNAAPELNGCPNLDHDGDTFDDTADKCPAAAETFDGVTDDDGCPEEKVGKPLATVVDGSGVRYVEWRVAPRFKKDDVDPKTLASLRAVAQELNAHPTWIAVVGVRPLGHTAALEQSAQNRAFAAALTLRWLTHRDKSAEAVGWGAVKDAPKADVSGIGVLLFEPRAAPAAPIIPAVKAPAP